MEAESALDIGQITTDSLTLKDRADPDKVGLYQLFKKPGLGIFSV